MNRLTSALAERATPRRAVLSLASVSALLLCENLLAVSPGVVYMRRVTGGLDFLDFGFSPATQAHELLVAFGPAGRGAQGLLIASVDVVVPFACGAFGVLAFTVLGRALFGSPGRWLVLAMIPVLATLFDYAENASIAFLLLTFPRDPAWLSILTHWLTSAKFLFYAGTAVLVLVTACAALVRRFAVRHGRRTSSWDRLRAPSSEGVVVGAEQVQDQAGVDDDGPALGLAQLVAGFWRHLRPYRGKLWVLLLLLLLDAGLSSMLPLGIKLLVDEAIVPQDRHLLFLILSALVAATLIVSAAAIARDWFYAYIGAGVLNDLRLALFEQLQRLSASFHAQSQAGDILARFTTDLAAVESTVSIVLPWGMMATLEIVWSLAVLFALQWQLALLALVAVPLSLLGPRLLGPGAASAGYRLKQYEATVTSAVQESLAGQYVIRAFGLEGRTREAFLRQLRDLGSQSRRFNFLSGLVQRTPNLTVGLVHVLVLGGAAFLTFRGELSIGSLVSFDLVFLNFAGGVASLTEVAPSFLRASGGLARIEELLAEQPSVQDPEKPLLLPRFARAISFRNVSFGYAADRLNLIGVSFEIARGSHVAFVGRSGSGKSTVLGLLLRFHDPTSGSVLIDGIDLREVRQSEARRQMAIVSQESFLFDTSIRENLLAAQPGATDSEIDAVVRSAEAQTFIDALPEGYDATVGERGDRLSGGQRQRLAIARALLRDPAILLLDEATSALDAATETALDRTLTHVGEGRTVVTVTHRLHSIVNADRIFVLEDGHLVEEGRHDDLLQRAGVYAEIWRKQNGLQIAADGTIASITAERLRLTPLLRDLDPAILDEVSHRFASEQVPGDRIVLQEGDHGDRFYIIARGRVAVSKGNEGDAERTVAVLETGDHFGELALLRDVPRTATVRTLSPCTFLTLQRGHFLELIERIPDLLPALEKVARRRAAAETEELGRTGPVSLRRAFEPSPPSRAMSERQGAVGPGVSRRLDADQSPPSRLRRPS